ncbi:RNA polymerase II nuclear localization protein iwr1 [Gigaspora margarita]|uniref:Probable RNA polymerase II nuclear localization protein SLC7A6OS n=1 Tax=Gigaspora margarita TaxID=4874 RepID=A0A8H4ES02_GIGMA|nr:RNA polymerase II nuclear localization protein iwr1 [Gigaspora margarita]
MEAINQTPEQSTIYEESTKTSYTIVRLKRKRNAEPLDALVVQQQLVKKPKRQGSLPKDMKATEEQKINEDSSLPFVFRFAETVDEINFNDSTKSQQLKDRITKLINRKDKVRPKERSIKQIRDQQIAWFNENTRRERYKVIDRNRQSGNFAHFSSDSVEDEENATDEMFKMYDAVKEELPIEPKFIEEDNLDSDIMCNFIPMVREYLTLQENIDKESNTDSDNDYVYDVYYHDDSMVFDDKPEYQNYASLTWFNDDDNGIFVKETAGKDDFEYSDEEDSNAEDYYTHDYPDEEEVWSEQEGYSSDEY